MEPVREKRAESTPEVPVPSRNRPAAVLFDRDGTLITDVPYNRDPDRVEPVPGAPAALARLRGARVPVGVVTNQSGVARGLISARELREVNARVEELLGPFDVWAVCPHDEADGCVCRKPAPGLVLLAATVLGVDARDCVVIGDIGRDMEAARAAGARGILVPTAQTLAGEVEAAGEVADDLAAAVGRAMRPGPEAVSTPPDRMRPLGSRPLSTSSGRTSPPGRQPVPGPLRGAVRRGPGGLS